LCWRKDSLEGDGIQRRQEAEKATNRDLAWSECSRKSLEERVFNRMKETTQGRQNNKITKNVETINQTFHLADEETRA
jgi:hypothetical protein